VSTAPSGTQTAVPHFPTETLVHLLEAYGYWAVALGVAIESTGIPFPGETVLILAATYAGRTHHISIPWIIAAAAAGAIAGDNLGFLAGRTGGFRLLRRYGRFIHIDERRLKLGLWLFRRYGGVVVFFGRFVAVLRAWAAILAGTNRMPWPHFLVANAAGGIVWATAVGLGGYFSGKEASRLTGAVGWVFLAVAAAGMVAAVMFIKRHERRLEDEAERALPGPIEEV
jgi:membrane protein DedA with SNARE-associated domain